MAAITYELSKPQLSNQQPNMEEVKTPAIRTYQEMVGRIPTEDLKAIEAKMEGLPEVDYHLNTIQKQLELGDYYSLHEDAFYYALRGVKEGKIAPKVVTRISDIETLRQQQILFKVIDPIETYQDPEVLKNFIYKATGKHLHEDKLNRFIETLKRLPKEDRYMMVFSSRNKLKSVDFHQKLNDFYKSSGNQRTVTISQILETRQKMNVFNRVRKPGENGHDRLFTSIELFEVFLQERFGDNRVKVNPVFGMATEKHVETNGLTHIRDVSHLYLIPNAVGGNQLVKYEKANQYPCEENDFNFYGRYQAFVASSIDPEYRIKSISIAQKIDRYRMNNQGVFSKEDDKALSTLSKHFKEIDYPQSYVIERNAQAKKPGPIRNQASEQEKARKGTPSLPFAEAIYCLLPLLHDITQAFLDLQTRDIDPKIQKDSKQIVDSLKIHINEFSSIEAVEKVYTIIDDEFLSDPSLGEGRDLYLNQIVGNVATALEDMEKNPISDPADVSLIFSKLDNLRRFNGLVVNLLARNAPN